MKTTQFNQLMRATVFLFTLILFFPLFSATIHSQSQTRSKIHLKGLFQEGGLRSGTDPIVLELQEKIMYIAFQKDVGNVYISVTNESGANVYVNTVNSAGLPSFTVFLTHLPAGCYTISFSNEKGVMWGEFLL